MVVDSVQCLGKLYGITSNVKEISDWTQLNFGNEISGKVGDSLIKMESSSFEYIDQGIEYLKTNCGYSQNDIDSVLKYSDQVKESLALIGTNPSAIPEFGDIAGLILKIALAGSVIFGLYFARRLNINFRRA